jgi:short-subunit dehydrogenase
VNSRERKTILVAGAVLAAGLFARRVRKDSLAGEVAIVTGGSRGLGYALARELLRCGCRVVICARREDELRKAAEELSRYGEVVPVVCDVSKQQDVERLVNTANEYFGRVDILVNNAGAIEVASVDVASLDDFRRMMDVMYWGTIYTSLAVLPQMRQRKHGRIVNITSIGGKISVPHLLPYSGAKFAAVGFSEGLHAEVAKDGVVVTTVVPGLMRTGSYRHARFKGDIRNEFRWFAVASTMPGLSISAKRAARQIVAAVRRRSREAIISAPAKLGVRVAGMIPGTVIALLALIDRLLPHDSAPVEASGIEAEWRIHSELLEKATALGRRAGRELNQV